MTAYYNEIDPYAAAWLSNLIAAGHIAPGEVDERSIEDVTPADLAGFTQCHFFAGVGVWSYALRLAGWPDTKPVWTGSCPCQPFSAAGQGDGFADERHLWPAFQHLIEQCDPTIVLGEQVASKDAEPWLDLVQDDLEALGYAVGAVAFPSASIGAPHIRDRLYWVADTDFSAGKQGCANLRGWPDRSNAQPRSRSGGGGLPIGLGYDDDARLEGLGCGHRAESGRITTLRPVTETGELGRLVNTDGRYPGAEREQCRGEQRQQREDGSRVHHGSARSTNGFWRDADWLFCRDGKWRPVEPGTFPLAHGATSRVGRLRAYGNAINAEQACVFIQSVMEA